MYKFNKEAHIHTFNDIPLHGVTTVLSVIAKPMLIQWAANMAVSYASANISSNKEYTEDELAKIFSEAKVAHRRKRDKAGDWGTAVHLAIEEWVKEGKEPALEGNQKIVFDKFKDWVKENKVEFLESEKHIWSEKLWIGGILDLVIKMVGKKYIADIKTSSGIYNEAFFQMAAYALCLEEMGEHKDIEGYLVINLKKDGTIDFKKADNMEVNKQAFLSALSLHKIIKSLE